MFAKEIGHHFNSYGDMFCLLKTNLINYNKNEYLAGKWAAEFLRPEYKLKELLDKDILGLTLKQIIDELEVIPELEIQAPKYVKNICLKVNNG